MIIYIKQVGHIIFNLCHCSDRGTEEVIHRVDGEVTDVDSNLGLPSCQTWRA